ncbi:hypothetical protein [Paenibacillus piscarius]|uniref:hypothetical protein n=1 Tax=Paenibacillus piscarius TaxID=1089681 RepID=UPI001EE80C08|nr:hypothetical protein [Paenibacillus piscarius]
MLFHIHCQEQSKEQQKRAKSWLGVPPKREQPQLQKGKELAWCSTKARTATTAKGKELAWCSTKARTAKTKAVTLRNHAQFASFYFINEA